MSIVTRAGLERSCLRRGGLAFVILAVAIPLAQAQQLSRTHDKSRLVKPPAISALRYDEDYSYLRDSKNRTGAWWERFKFIPLDSAGQNYLTVGDETRLRYEE